MTNHRFIHFLVNNGVIEEKTVLEVLDTQMKQKIPIGQIALKEKALTVSQVYSILLAQMDSQKLFGETALDMGYLTETDIEELLAIQRNRLPRIEEILVKMNIIDHEKCSIIMNKYENELST